MAETPLERARRLAAACPAQIGDPVLIDATIHRVERASYHLADWVQTFCNQAAVYKPPGDTKRNECQSCASLWRVKAELLKLRALASSE